MNYDWMQIPKFDFNQLLTDSESRLRQAILDMIAAAKAVSHIQAEIARSHLAAKGIFPGSRVMFDFHAGDKEMVIYERTTEEIYGAVIHVRGLTKKGQPKVRDTRALRFTCHKQMNAIEDDER